MSNSRPLPDVAVLEKLLLGQLPSGEAEAVCAQLQDSEQFAVLAQSLIASDTLIEALHAQITKPTPRPDARLEGLMARLCKLRPNLSGADSDHTAALEPVSAGTPISFLSPAQQADELGRLGEYRVLKVLGQGGMGVVLLAEDVRLGRRVALKTMRPETAQMAHAKQRFIREARTTAAIEHDHIIPIYQVGEENGVPFLAMPFLRGEPLDERLKRAEGKPVPLREIVRIGREIAEGLSAAHEQGLIHRDIKPANVWLEGERGRVKVLDFGLARAVREDTQLTQSGAIVGTPAYMAPEQARGEAVDARCDLFGLGCILYQMSTGQKPFSGPDTMSILMSLALDQPMPPRQRNAELPAELSDLITRLLAKKPEDRPASARAVSDALAAIERGLCDTTLVQTESIAPIVTMPKPARRRQGLAVAVAAAMLLIGGVFAAVVIIRDKSGKEVARVNVPEDGSVEVKPDDKQRPPEKEKEQSDEDKPFVLLRDNKEVRAFKTLFGVFNEMQNGDTIEVHGNGPFALGLVRLQGKDLSLRAAPGYRPKFVPNRPLDQQDHAWFEIKDGALNIAGCDFRQPTGCIAFAGGGKPWELRNCRILCGGPIAEYAGPRLRVTDSLTSGNLWLGPKVELELDNNIIILETHQQMALQSPGGQIVHLRNNTIHLVNNSGALFELKEAKGVSVEAAGNILLFSDQYRVLFGIPPTDIRERVRWSGRHNLYAGLIAPLSIFDPKTSTNQALDLGGKPLAANVKLPLSKSLGRDEEGSRLVDYDRLVDAWCIDGPMLFQRQQARLQDQAGIVRTLREATAHLRQRPGLADVGPDWDLVGSGDAYMRALAAAGKPVAKENLRPEAVEGGPFTLLRGGKVVRGYDTLQNAINAAIGGDVIDIRNDGPFPGGGINADVELTIRAAPGYRAIVDGDVNIAKGTVTLEGLHFRTGGTWFQGRPGRLVRLANCFFETRKNGRGFVAVVGKGKQTEVVNCLALDMLNCDLDKDGKLDLRNSVIGSLIAGVDAQSKLNLDRCLVWAPATKRALWSGGRKAPLDVTARRTIVEDGDGFLLSGVLQLSNISRWKGSHNVYRIASVQFSLDDWRKRWKQTEEGSVEDEPLIFDPRQWRLLPQSPGYHAGPNGKDFGADVDRIAVATKPGEPAQTK